MGTKKILKLSTLGQSNSGQKLPIYIAKIPSIRQEIENKKSKYSESENF